MKNYLHLNFKNEDFLYNTFKQHPNILIELLELQIIRANFVLFGEIFRKHKKDIILKKNDYKKLLDITSRINYRTTDPNDPNNPIIDNYEYNKIITQYEIEDMLYNNDDDDEIIEKEKELESKNYDILLLQKDKKIETLKIELEELRKFYIDS